MSLPAALPARSDLELVLIPYVLVPAAPKRARAGQSSGAEPETGAGPSTKRPRVDAEASGGVVKAAGEVYRLMSALESARGKVAGLELEVSGALSRLGEVLPVEKEKGKRRA